LSNTSGQIVQLDYIFCKARGYQNRCTAIGDTAAI
jgi:hypothetical protein